MIIVSELINIVMFHVEHNNHIKSYFENLEFHKENEILTSEYVSKCKKWWRLFLANYKPEKPHRETSNHPQKRRCKKPILIGNK